MREQTKVILVTDGDNVARKAVEKAANKLGLRCISSSAGNPTKQSGYELVKIIKSAKHDPVVVMLDDRGYEGKGRGERAAEVISKDPGLKILGAVAVASNTSGAFGTKIDCCITYRGEKTYHAVDKAGEIKAEDGKVLKGDTVDVLEDLDIPYIVGIGDPGKMTYEVDNAEFGAPITTMAIEEILRRHGIPAESDRGSQVPPNKTNSQ